MHQIGVIVGGLDAATRARVLRWAVERFVATSLAAAEAVHGRAAEPVNTDPDMPAGSDETLSVAALEDFFDRREAAKRPRERERATAAPTTGMLHEFVAEFQEMVREWNVACGVPVEARAVRSGDAALKTAS
jgi:hypothetical protein